MVECVVLFLSSALLVVVFLEVSFSRAKSKGASEFARPPEVLLQHPLLLSSHCLLYGHLLGRFGFLLHVWVAFFVGFAIEHGYLIPQPRELLRLEIYALLFCFSVGLILSRSHCPWFGFPQTPFLVTGGLDARPTKNKLWCLKSGFSVRFDLFYSFWCLAFLIKGRSCILMVDSCSWDLLGDYFR